MIFSEIINIYEAPGSGVTGTGIGLVAGIEFASYLGSYRGCYPIKYLRRCSRVL